MALFLLLGLLISSTKTNAIETNNDSTIRYIEKCDVFQYKMKEYPFFVLCSSKELNQEKLHTFKIIYNNFIKLYSNYILKYGYEWHNFKITNKIIILSKNEMNSNKRFAYSDDVVVGRYYTDTHTMYVEEKSIILKNSDIPHELAHAANSELGISNKDIDEDFAYDFEGIYNEKYK